MRLRTVGWLWACAWLLWAVPVGAQQTTGTLQGRVQDNTGGVLPGVNVEATQASTGYSRVAVTDAQGVYRLTALPVGQYSVSVELSGFRKIDRQGVVINVGQTIDINFSLEVANVAETIQVTGESPLIQSSSSSVGGVVDIGRIEQLPLNGRQFANLAATIPGVGLGFHTDPTKSTQYSPQINGGNGRNVNYQIDGGDNNDDTVGGLLQAFPLEAIQEFNFQTQRFKAEYGRSNGGVLNVVTKSGSNRFSGSAFEFVRGAGLNSKTQNEELANLDKQDYKRNQFGGSFGGPIVEEQDLLLRRARAHPAGHDAGGQHARAVPGQGRRLRGAVSREPADGEGLGESVRLAPHVGPLRPQQQLAALQRGRQQHVRQLGRQQERRSTRSTSITTGWSAGRS